MSEARADWFTPGSDDKTYIKHLEEKLEQATLHQGYIAKAPPAEQQCLDLAEQLMKLQTMYAELMKLYQKQSARILAIAQYANERDL